MRRIVKRIVFPFFSRYYKWYYSKPRWFSYKGIKVKVLPGIFFPKYTISTKILLNYVDSLNLKNKSFLELGAGSGIVSFYAESRGANVVSSDISNQVIKGLELNKAYLKSQLKIIHSDLFDNISQNNFEYIFINPPYYPKKVDSESEMAWFCGENFEYFEKLFNQLPDYISSTTECLMILSEDCEIEKIKSIANRNQLSVELIKTTKVAFENNFIFRIKK